MMQQVILSLALASTALALPQFPGIASATGKFGAGSPTPAGGKGPAIPAAESASMAAVLAGMTKDTTGGSGPYKSSFGPVPGLAKHTLYMPTTVPAGVTLPAIVWGNGGCLGKGDWFSKFLNEIASHGFFIIANGDPNGSLASMTSQNDMPDAIEWIYKNAGSGNYSAVNKEKLAASGQSCGGLQAYTASLDKRVKLTALFNSGLTNAGNTKMLEDLHAPVGYFTGGADDGAKVNSDRDFKNLPTKIPSVRATLPPVGHMATYGDQYGGKFGKAAVLFFKWQLKGDKAAGQEFLQPSSLKTDGWEITSRGF